MSYFEVNLNNTIYSCNYIGCCCIQIHVVCMCVYIDVQEQDETTTYRVLLYRFRLLEHNSLEQRLLEQSWQDTMGIKNSSLNRHQHSESKSIPIDFLVTSHKIWDKVEQKMWIEVHSYKEQNDQFWREMLTHIGKVYIINNFYNIRALYYIGTEGQGYFNGSGFDWNIYATSWIYTGTKKYCPTPWQHCQNMHYSR